MRILSSTVVALPFTLIGGLLAGCDDLPMRLRKDPTGTMPNASTSRWRGTSSDGTHSRVRQVATGPNTFSFSEDWYEGSKVLDSIHTVGTGRYEPSTQTNIYTYTKPVAGVVVVRTEDNDDGISTRDTVINSTLPLFKVGEVITYIREE
ncbi:MAG: hypothetical protein ACKO0M_14070 [Cyanobium sp.]